MSIAYLSYRVTEKNELNSDLKQQSELGLEIDLKIKKGRYDNEKEVSDWIDGCDDDGWVGWICQRSSLGF
jgi:hypothetical protein